MTFDLFEQALCRGLGRALTFLRENPSPEATQSVLGVILTSSRVDPHVEEVGTMYLLEAARLCGMQEDLTPLLVTALHERLDQDDDPSTLEQLLDLLAELGKNGDAGARQTLVALIPRFLDDHWDGLPQLTASISHALGAQGLRLLLGEVGAALLSGERALEDERLWFVASQTLGEEIEIHMEQWGLQNRGIQVFLQQSRRCRQQEKTRRRPLMDVSYPAILARVREGRMHGLSHRGEKASRETLDRLAWDLELETDPDQMALLLCVFHRRPFPFGPEPLLKWLDHPSHRVKEKTLLALSPFVGDLIHDLALSTLQDPDTGFEAIKLLMKNFRSGDEQALRAALQQIAAQEDEQLLHDFVRALDGLVERWPEPGMLDLLTEAFPHQPCSFCREMLFGVLEQHGHLPPALVREASLDRNTDLRIKALRHLDSWGAGGLNR